MKKAETNVVSTQIFDLVNNYSNEMWNAINSQAKFMSVTQQQWSVALMNNFQKHHQAQKEQMAIFETMAEQIRVGQGKTLEAMQENLNQSLERLNQVYSEFKAQAQSQAQSKE